MFALLWSYAFVFSVIGVATVFDKITLFNDEGARKFIHIGVANWWLVAMLLFDQDTFYLAIIPPATFIVLNYLSYRFNLVKSMERETKSTNDLGTVYYALSLFVIAYVAFRYGYVIEGAVAILAMGYGDGLGAVIGQFYGKKKLYQNKTVLGTLTMFIVTLVIAMIVLLIGYKEQVLFYVFVAFSVAAFAALVELFTPKGLDNLSVPLLIFGLLWLVTLL